ncbi:MAG: hypothetical protein AB8B95_09380 [Pseudohongiellaceae bacterium]
MADEEENQAEETEQDPVAELQKNSKRQLILLFAACATSLIFLVILGFTYTTLSEKLLMATQEPLLEMENLTELVSDEYSNLTMTVEFYNHQMEILSKRLDDIEPAIDQAQFDELKQLIINQEQDLQLFLLSAQEAIYGLSEMISGSRGWREDFKGKLDLAIAASQARELSIMEEAGSPMAATVTNQDDSAAP